MFRQPDLQNDKIQSFANLSEMQYLITKQKKKSHKKYQRKLNRIRLIQPTDEIDVSGLIKSDEDIFNGMMGIFYPDQKTKLKKLSK